jgi:hypothetical protein
MPAGSTYTPIATTTLGSATTSYTFTSIPTTYTDLILIVNAKNSATGSYPKMQLGNGSVDTGANYSRTFLSGTGSSALSGRNTGYTFASLAAYADSGTTFDYTAIAHLMNYSNTTTFKTILVRANSSQYGVDAQVDLWRSTVAINTIKVLADTNFEAGTTFTLYGIAAA